MKTRVDPERFGAQPKDTSVVSPMGGGHVTTGYTENGY